MSHAFDASWNLDITWGDLGCTQWLILPCGMIESRFYA